MADDHPDDRPVHVTGSSLQGYVTATYAAMVHTFDDPGPPLDPDKSHLGWVLGSGYAGRVCLYDYGDVHDCDGHWYVPMGVAVVLGTDRADMHDLAGRALRTAVQRQAGAGSVAASRAR